MKDLLLKLVVPDWKHFNGAALLLRLFVGCMMLPHGWAKLVAFPTLSTTFPDPFGVGSAASLVMVLLAELGCSLLIIFGCITRLATLVLIFQMLVILFAIHAGDAFATQELPLLYLGMYTILFWSGAGKYSLDEIIRRKLIHRVTPE